MKIESTTKNGQVERSAHIFGDEYDLSHRPVIFVVLTTLIMLPFLFIFAVGLWALSAVAPRLIEMFGPYAPYIAGAVVLWIALGVLKYKLTGSARPFFKFTVKTTTRTISTEPENTE